MIVTMEPHGQHRQHVLFKFFTIAPKVSGRKSVITSSNSVVSLSRMFSFPLPLPFLFLFLSLFSESSDIFYKHMRSCFMPKGSLPEKRALSRDGSFTHYTVVSET